MIMKNSKNKILTISIPEAIYAELDKMAKVRGINVSSVIKLILCKHNETLPK